MSDSPLVRVVHCVDTEGPLDESVEATFERLGKAFGMAFEPSPQKLESLRRGEGVPPDIRDAVMRMLDPHLYSFRRNWSEIDEMLDRVQSPAFRRRLPDHHGEGWVFSWFCVDHVGYEINPRSRDLGHHKVWDHYRARMDASPGSRDVLQFHYHPFPWNAMAHSCATSYLHSAHLVEILGRKILERKWFPSVFRPGFHVVRPDSHWFLEQWFPFDFSNQSTDEEIDQPDLADGRFGDWRRAPRTWRGYHPDHRDWQKEGGCRRTTFRCLNLESRLRRLRPSDVLDAFQEAEETGSAVLSFTSHDFRDMEPEILAVHAMLEVAKSRHPTVEFEYCDALTAARGQQGAGDVVPPSMSVRCEESGSARRLRIDAREELFGPQPFLVLEDDMGRILHDNLDFEISPKSWAYTFDWQTIPVERLRRIGIAATSPQGAVEVLEVDPRGQILSRSIHHA